jgi:ABC-type lipoprotein release transport system permease subunit
MNILRLAWRNLWRNKRRTLITAASLFFAVFFAIVMRALQLGAYDRLFKNVIESYTGYIQIQHKDYLDEAILDNCFTLTDSLTSKIEKVPNVKGIMPRLESFALAAAGSKTQGVMIIGIDPDKESKLTGLKNRSVKFRLSPEAVSKLKKDSLPARTIRLLDASAGESFTSEFRIMSDLGISVKDSSYVLPLVRRDARYVNGFLSESDSDRIIIGNNLSDYLKINTGDTLVILGQGYHGTSAAGKFVVAGIIKLPTPDIDNILVYMNIVSAGRLFNVPGMSTSAVISLFRDDDKSISLTAGRLKKMLSAPLIVRPWQELNSLMVNQMEADNRSGMIFIGILYLVIAFGVFGTVLMMMAERRREFGMLVSVGMQKKKLAAILSLEMLLMGFVGIVSGVIASLPLVFYLHYHPIRFTGEMAKMYEDYGFEPVMPTLLPGGYYLWQIVIVLVILVIAILFSIRKIFRMNVISALRA